ncbi:unnamed protein product [Colias eurytheme]|nr:unnamed protein product [Colias eurytheme]
MPKARPPHDRIQNLLDFPPPETVQGMRRFLGMINFYRRFIPQAARFQAPLITAIVATNGKGAKPFPWSPELLGQFDACKKSLCDATLLQHPIADAALGLFTDASSVHIGACLHKQDKGEWVPLAFFSKKLTPPQSQWPAYYRELLAVGRATVRLITERYVWPSVNKDCKEWARTCEACQRANVSRHNSAPLGDFNLPPGRCRHVHIDIIGPLTTCDGYRYCLTAIDRVTRWPEVWPMRTITADEVVETFTREWVSSFGVPSIITTDQGTQFESDLFRRLMQ